MVSYCDPSPAAIIKGQHRVQPLSKTKEIVKARAKMSGQYNPKTGNVLDATDGSEIIGFTPDMGHIEGHEYTREFQRAFMNGESEMSFRNRMMNVPDIYQLEAPSKTEVIFAKQTE